MRKPALIMGATLLAAVSGIHAEAPPSGAAAAPAELQAVYCESVLQNDLRLLQQMLDAARSSAARGDDIPPEVRKHVLESLRQTQEQLPVVMQARKTALDRVQSYLAPRRNKLDSSSVGAAQERAEADISAMASMANTCANRCESPAAGVSADACSKDCLGKDLPGRLDRCRTPTWLP